MALGSSFVSETPNTDAAAAPSYWQLHVIDPIARQLTQGITPEKVALTLAVGSALALFPILGTTTLLCLVAGICLRLNQPIIQLVNALCTPIHLPVIYGFVRMGNWMFDAPYAHIHPSMIRDMREMFWADPHEFFEMFGRMAAHSIVAWAAIAPFWMILVYLVALPVLREALRRQAAAAQACAEPDHPVP